MSTIVEPPADKAEEARPKRVGAYAKLLANYASDDAIIAAGEAAELLFVRGLAFCATSDADGYITDAQVARYVGAGMRDAAKRAARLVEVGVWERVAGGYVVRSWLKIHDSSAKKGYVRAKDRERKAKKPDSDEPSEGNPAGIRTEGSAESLSLIQDRTVQSSSEQVDKSLGGDRPVTLRAVAATEPPNGDDDERCTRHPNGNPADENCGGCKRIKDRRDRRHEANAERARLASEKAARECTRCDGVWVLDDEKRPTRTKCTSHRRTA